jgi:RNA polymerase sigma-70 factor (ECF subfamily)
MTPDASFEDLLARVRQGDDEAARRVYAHFAGRLVALARTRLEPRLQRKIDAEDVMLSVLKSFFRHHADAPFDLDGWDALWALLTRITLRKCGYQTRHFRAACRDFRREATPALEDPESSRASWEAVGREPTPEQAALLADEVETLLGGLDAHDRAIVELTLQGYRPAEVAERAGAAERTVYRVLGRVRTRLERRAQEAEER